MNANEAMLHEAFPQFATVVQTCQSHPEQYEGVLTDGRRWYFRYRHGGASLGLGDTLDAAIEDPHAAYLDCGYKGQGEFHSDDARRSTFVALLAQRGVA